MKQKYRKNQNWKKWISYKPFIIGLVLIVIVIGVGATIYAYSRSEGIRFVRKMKVGWNLGNSLDVCDRGINNGKPELYEVYWGNPATTKIIIDKVKAEGFNTVRIPVTWYEHMDDRGRIDEMWMNRVQEVVDYVIDNEMYAIINIHHDKWLVPNYKNQNNTKKMLISTWEQIAKRFENYDNHLIFEGMNEPRLVNTKYEWNGGNEEGRDVVNKLNDAFVKTIRKSSGKNKDRYLMIAPYCNFYEKEALEDFILPKDNHIIVSIHAYVPYDFTMNKDGRNNFGEEDKEDIDKVLDELYNSFIMKDIPVIISEFGTADKNNLNDRIQWSEYYITTAKKKDIMCLWWDDGSNKESTGKYELLDRYNLKWIYPEIVDVLVREYRE